MDTLINTFRNFFKKPGTVSYAQYGEDIIVQGIFDTLHLPTPTYIDIGTHHATNLSNTYFFYKRGSRGICIEPSLQLYQQIKKVRPRDICLNVGISDSAKEQVPYYVMTAQTMNTFSKEDAQKTMQAKDTYGDQKIESISHVDLVPMSAILQQYFSIGGDFISIDTEGMDEQIIKNIDFSLYRPKVLCVETIEQDSAGAFHKNATLIEYMVSKNYFVYADTFVNTIFVDKMIWTLS